MPVCLTDEVKRTLIKGERYWGCDTVEVFQDLWDSINAKCGYSWEINPWVWVIEFKGVEGVA
jgi:hypothetical protein